MDFVVLNYWNFKIKSQQRLKEILQEEEGEDEEEERIPTTPRRHSKMKSLSIPLNQP